MRKEVIIMLNKKSYIKAINKLGFNQFEDEFLEIYEIYIGRKKCESVSKLIEGLLNKIYRIPGTSTTSIPMEFILSDLGTFLFKMLFNDEERIYTTGELVELTGNTRQYISAEVARGNLRAFKETGRWKYKKSDVVEFLRAKGIELD